jgi:hypothetical protein
VAKDTQGFLPAQGRFPDSDGQGIFLSRLGGKEAVDRPLTGRGGGICPFHGDKPAAKGPEMAISGENRQGYGVKIFLDIPPLIDIDQSINDMTYGHIVTAVHIFRDASWRSESGPNFK